ncbi:MAG: hypothetical protein IBX64_06605 [Actinobacteria bacterium]|nr:hypothetical protein [Actinomycetota bacterium]
MKPLFKKSLVGVLVLSVLVFASILMRYSSATSVPPDGKEIYKGPVDGTPSDVSEARRIQGKYLQGIHTAMEQVFGSIENFKDVGVFYFENEPEPKAVFGFKGSDEKIEAFKNIVKKEIPEDILVIRDVEYTESELSAKHREVAQDVDKYGVEAPKTLGANTSDQKLELTVRTISDEAKQALQAKYGDLLEITVDKDLMPEPAIGGTRD